jgi:hypothetical protein
VRIWRGTEVVAADKALVKVVDVAVGEAAAADRVAWVALRQPGRAATVFVRIAATG